MMSGSRGPGSHGMHGMNRHMPRFAIKGQHSHGKNNMHNHAMGNHGKFGNMQGMWRNLSSETIIFKGNGKLAAAAEAEASATFALTQAPVRAYGKSRRNPAARHHNRAASREAGTSATKCRRSLTNAPVRTLRHYLDAAPDCRIPVTALHASFFKFTIGGLSSSMTVTALALQPATRREILISPSV